MKTKPLPCPFCGKNPKFIFIEDSFARPEMDGFWSLGCGQRSKCTIYPSASGDTKEEAVAAWNTRSPLP